MAAECCSSCVPKNTNGRLTIPALAGLLVLIGLQPDAQFR